MRADLVLFDADAVVDNATFTEPHQYASGIDYVVVNGVIVVEDGATTGHARARSCGGGISGQHLPWNVLVRLFWWRYRFRLSGGSDISYSDWPLT